MKHIHVREERWDIIPGDDPPPWIQFEENAQ